MTDGSEHRRASRDSRLRNQNSPDRNRSHREGETGDSESGELDFGQFVSEASRRWAARTDERAQQPVDRPGATARRTRGDGSGGSPPNPPPPSGDEPPPPFRFNRNLLLIGVIALVGLISTFLVGNQLSDTEDPTPTVVPTEVPTEIPILPTEAPPQPTATVEIVPTNTPEPTAEPTFDVEQSEVARLCETACLARVPNSDETTAILEITGDRASHVAGDSMWLVGTRETLARLDVEGQDVTLIRDAPDTLHVYIATLPEGQSDTSVLNGFGEVLDAEGRTVIVEVALIPAQVRGVASAGVDIVKFPPAATPPSENPDESLPTLTNNDIYALAGDVNDEAITDTIVDLQGSSSTDGTGIGTRHYLLPGNVMSAEYLFQRLESYGLTVRYQDFISPEGTLTSNVIGELPGRDDSAIYGIMAHFDSISDPFSVAPGADDNASGVAAALEIARILSGYELEHPVHIIFVNLEETGIIGSRVFAQAAVAEGVPYEGIFNVDSIGSGRIGSQIWLNSDTNSEWMMALMIRINDAYGLGQNIEARINPAIVADDNRLREQGLESILVARELYGTSPYHHTTDDVLENVSIPLTVTSTQLILLTVASLVVE